ncbi:glycosyltransferase family 4 protein [Bradyrhizobium neotropicale]|uniref:glycosyltransferase family 4 protein n=1 Tax=Bradyrhizobium neotropicale TaxID=1497615 RepID=UPI001AD6BDD1|nr:glycosyltransferase family 4 protein [Bradyrhizobium neotropicale]MBO4223580.1 glycosyltransferase [Bradyrhizobium neotropicale]
MIPTILYFASEDWVFLEHFSVTGRAALEAGLKVNVATRVRNSRRQLENRGFGVIPLESERRNLGILYNLLLIVKMAKVIAQTKPAIVHCIGLRMVVLGGLAARLARVKHLVLMPTGLIYLWINEGIRIRMLREAVRWLVKHLLHRPGTEFIFENSDDPIEFGIPPHAANLTIIGGVGVEPNEYPFVREPATLPIKIGVVARMLQGKGIAEAVEAVRQVRAEGVAVELHLYGDVDRSSRMTLSEGTLRSWEQEGGVFWHGRVSNIDQVWRTHHIAMLLSHREGLPRSLLEAAAAGRPIITTNVVGCRDVIRDQIEGFIVPKRSAAKAAERLRQLALDPTLRQRMGEAAHQRFIERFTAGAVQSTIKNVYCRILERTHHPTPTPYLRGTDSTA